MTEIFGRRGDFLSPGSFEGTGEVRVYYRNTVQRPGWELIEHPGTGISRWIKYYRVTQLKSGFTAQSYNCHIESQAHYLNSLSLPVETRTPTRILTGRCESFLVPGWTNRDLCTPTTDGSPNPRVPPCRPMIGDFRTLTRERVVYTNPTAGGKGWSQAHPRKLGGRVTGPVRRRGDPNPRPPL